MTDSTAGEKRGQITLLYHYFHPDDVVSARIFSDLAEGLSLRGWQVRAWPCNRSCHDDKVKFALREQWGRVSINRVWRPGFRQSSNLGRMLNAIWMIAMWSWRALTYRREPNEAVIIGTDPILAALVAVPWRLFRPKSKIVFWCFDLYPEAAIADGLVRKESWLVQLLKWMLGIAYRRCDLMVDIGMCMKQLLANYRSQAKTATLVPWALVEPTTISEPDVNVRKKLFGDAKLGLLYSGSFGRAHRYEEFLALARKLRGTGVVFCFAGRGNRAEELRRAITPEDTNITFAGFAPEDELALRLTACDIHLVSLREDWTGTVVPSKFFGALAASRGVLFAGSNESAIARWIVEHELGYVVDLDHTELVAAELARLAEQPEALLALRRRAFETYQSHFSKEAQLDGWDRQLADLVGSQRLVQDESLSLADRSAN